MNVLYRWKHDALYTANHVQTALQQENANLKTVNYWLQLDTYFFPNITPYMTFPTAILNRSCNWTGFPSVLSRCTTSSSICSWMRCSKAIFPTPKSRKAVFVTRRKRVDWSPLLIAIPVIGEDIRSHFL